MVSGRLKRYVILVAVICLVGCSAGDVGTSGEENIGINEQALKYLEDKYGEEFEYSFPWGNSMSGNHCFLVRCNSFEGRDITVAVKDYREDSRKFLDNYLAFKYEKETLGFFEDIFSEYLGTVNVIYEIGNTVNTGEVDAGSSFEEYLEDEIPDVADKSGFSVFVEINKDTFNGKEAVKKLEEVLNDKLGGYSVGMVLVDDKDFGKYEEQDLRVRMVEEYGTMIYLVKFEGKNKMYWYD